MTCDVPHREKKFTVKFQKVSPSPFGLEFEEGAYYIICKSQHISSKGWHSAIGVLAGAKVSALAESVALSVKRKWSLVHFESWFFGDHFAKKNPAGNILVLSTNQG